MRKWMFQLLGLLALAGAILLGFAQLGRTTRNHVRSAQEYAIDFGAIQCIAPPGENLADFLAEVRYLSGQPARLQLFDDALPASLATAFVKHPWVQNVQRVEIVGHRQVEVRLRYRVPVLAVTWFETRPSGKNGDDAEAPVAHTRVVDEHAVLLPSHAVSTGLPLFDAGTHGPDHPAGSVWQAPGLVSAAAVAGLLRGYQKRLHVDRLILSKDGLVLQTPQGSRVLWGHAPGQESTDESPASQKRERLLAYCNEFGDLDHPTVPCEHDVRPRDKAHHRPLAARVRP